jgi:hypothetical protein
MEDEAYNVEEDVPPHYFEGQRFREGSVRFATESMDEQ